MGLLDGDLADSIFASFKGRLLKGVIRQDVVPTSGGLDRSGDAIDVAQVDTPIEGFTDRYSAFFRAQAGIPATDLKVCIFASSIPGITPAKDDKVAFDRNGVRTWHQLRAVATDPAIALFECQAFEIEDPDA